MKRTNLNFVIDAVAFVAFVLLTSTGVLMYYILPPGSGRFSILWGMDRHEWGQLHFWIAVVMMSFLGLHLFLHWKWIIRMIKGRPYEGSGIRLALSIVGIIALLILAVMPLTGRVEQAGEPPHRMRSADPATLNETNIDIDGTMTLADVERLTGVRAEIILSELGLPNNVPKNEQLGRLRKDYTFKLDDIREVVKKHIERK